MQNPINTQPIQQFIQQVDIKTAKLLMYCLADVNARLLENYDALLQKVAQNTGESVNIQMDGGGFK